MVTYKDAGVNVDNWNITAELMRSIVKKSYNNLVVTELGSFGGAFSASKIKKMKNPILVSTIDGVGTKTKIARMLDNWESVGYDIVNHSANDLLCVGAKPIFFLDYIAGSKLDKAIVLRIVNGISEACKAIDCPLVGGETAEMPSVYEENEYDIAGCMVGIVEKEDILPKKTIKKGDVVLGIASNGLHTNGYSLARHIVFDLLKLDIHSYVPELGETIGESLIKPHKEYSSLILNLSTKKFIKGIAHITGGGIVDNLPRILPSTLGAKIYKDKINVLPIFRFLIKNGNVPEDDAWQAFNMGIGLILVVSKNNAKVVIDEISKKGEKIYHIGEIVVGNGVQFV